MSSSDTENYEWATEASINSFIRHPNKSKRILVLCGAGLSAPSGIPTFKGSGATWRNHKAASLSNIETFETNSGLIWKYFAHRRRLALEAEPNRAHVALAGVAKKKKEMVVMTQNIDGAMDHGARVAWVNLDAEHTGGHAVREEDWVFGGDVEEVLDVLFEGVLINR